MAQGVTIDFTANLVKFTENVDKMAGNLDKFQGRVDTMASNVNKTLAGLGVGISVAGLASFVKSGIDAADALSKLSARTGIAVEDLAGLKLAADLSDTSIENVGAAINKLGINIARDSEAFKQLGISTKDPLEAFLQFADIFASIDDDQQRAAVGAAALGKSYAELAPLLVQGSDALREQIAEGQSYNQITAEQAEKAAAFNDELTRLQTRVQNFSINLAGPALEALNAFAQGVQFATEVTQGFDPLGWLNAGGYGASGKAGQLQYLNEQINETAAALDKLANRSVSGQIADAILGGNDYEELADKLVKLQKQRDALTAPAAQTASAAAPSQSAINNILKITDESAKKATASAKSAVSANDARLKSVNAIIAGLQRDIEISRLSEGQQRRALELSNALANARGAEVQTITDLVNAKYNQIEVDKRQSDQWQQLISDANDYYDLRKDIGRLSDTNLTLDSFTGGIGQIQDQLNAGIINPDQAKRLFDQLGQSYNSSFIEPAKTGTDQLSEYSIQAAHNMQSAFADFLFDPFEAGMDGLLTGFVDIVRRMAAEAASAQLMESLFGKTGVKDGGGIFGALFSGLVGATGSSTLNADVTSLVNTSGLFANGGIMTSAGPLPLNKYASGGIASSPQLAIFGEGRTNEAYVPLPDGRSIPVTMAGGAGGMVNNITINVQGGSNPDETGRKIGEAFVRTIARDEIASATRPGNKLNQTTRF